MKDDYVAMVNKEGPCRGEITKFEVREGVIIKFILSRRLSVNRGDLQDVRDATAGGAAAGKRHGDTFVFGSVGRHCRPALARSKTKGRVDDKGQNDRADNADRRAVGVNRNRRQGTGREGDDGDDNTCLRHWLSFYLED